MPPPADTSTSILTMLRETVAALQQLAALSAEERAALRLPGAGTFAFRRMSEPLRVPVSVEPTRFDVPPGFFAEGGSGYKATSFYVVNPNKCWVRLRGSNGSFQAATPETGWLWQPGFAGAFSTRFPDFMSALAVAMPGVPLPDAFAPLEFIYGGGT